MLSMTKAARTNLPAHASVRIAMRGGLSLRERERQAGHQAALNAARSYGITTPELSVMYRESGAPLFREVSGVNVSISHSGVYAIAAVSPHPIGVDIERVRHRDPRMYDYISSEEEQELLDGHEWQTPTAITTLWTIKESVMKAATVGLEWAPRTLLIESIARGDGGVATSVVRDPSGVRWYVITVRDTSNYIISFAEPV